MERYLGSNIRRLRLKYGWSQKELADKLDKKKSAISSYENDSKLPTLETAIKMSEIFSISLDELIYDDNADVVSVRNLSREKKEVILDLVQELARPTTQGEDYSLQQMQLISKILKQFTR